MKYIRKIAWLIIIVVFLASLATGVGIVLAVKNVNVTLISYTYDGDSDEAVDEIASYKERFLNEMRGTIISFVDESAAQTVLDGSVYTLVSFEKKFPCTIDITISERREVYCSLEGGKYSVYDEYGGYLRTAADFEGAFNPVDNAPNVIISGAQSDEDIGLVAYIGGLFESNFAPLRSTVESIKLEKSQSQYVKSRIIFYLRCGLTVEVQEYEDLAAEKLAKAYGVFVSLSGEDKLGGIIYSFGSVEGASATYARGEM